MNSMLERRLANDGVWYTETEFDKFYPGEKDWLQKAPRQNERRIYFQDGQGYDAQWFFQKNKELGGKKWTRHERRLWDESTTMVSGHLLPTAPPASSFVSSGVPVSGGAHNGGAFTTTYTTKYSNIGGSSVGGNVGAGNSSSGCCRRLADDGKWWSFTEFMSFYPGQPERWDNSPREDERRIDGRSGTGMPHNAQWFYDRNAREGGPQWTKNYKPGWQEAGTTPVIPVSITPSPNPYNPHMQQMRMSPGHSSTTTSISLVCREWDFTCGCRF